MTRARQLSKLANSNILSVDTSNNIGIGSTTPDAKLDVAGEFIVGSGASITTAGEAVFAGVVTATSFSGSGANLTGVGTQALNVQAQSLTVAGISTFADDVRVLAGGLDVVGVITSNNKVVATGLDIGTAGVDVDGQTDLDELVVAGVSTFSAKSVFNTGYPSIDADNELQVGTAIQLGKVGIVTALGLDISTGGVDIDGQIDLDEVAVAGVATFGAALHSSDIRIKNIAEESSILAGNTVDLNWGTNGNVAICTTPTGDVTLRVNSIPTSGFDNQNITFSAIVASSGTARTCTAVKLNGVAKTILWAGGSLGNATDGLTTSMGYIVQSFTGINTIGSGSTAANYQLLGVINGPYEA